MQVSEIPYSNPIPTGALPPLPATVRKLRRTRQFAVFTISVVWFFVASLLAISAASGLAMQFNLIQIEPLIDALCLVFLLGIGFAALKIVERRLAPLALTLGLPRRATAGQEWATGAAIGWGMGVAAVLPLLFRHALRVDFWTTPHTFLLLMYALATLGLQTLAQELAFRGYPFQRLIEATGPTRATIVMALLFGVRDAMASPQSSRFTVAIAMLSSLILSAAWLRTHALWLPWGLHFAWIASTEILFGMPSHGAAALATVVQTHTVGPTWLTGGSFGLDAARFTAIVLLVGIVVLVRATSDYAWKYTHPPLIPAGYDVTIPPPAAHVAMEAAATEAKPIHPASLVQILPASPAGPPINPTE